MQLDFEALRDACFSAARGTLWDVRPTDVARIQELTDSFLSIAMSHVGRITEQGRDPNLLVRAVRYLAHTHAIPAMHDCREWFIFMLAALVELACPTKTGNGDPAGFFADVEEGITLARGDQAS